MKLTDFYTLLEQRGLDKETVNRYFQQAYKSVVDEIRLDQSIHPLRLSGAGRIGGFEHPVTLYPSKSKMAFKEVNKYLKTDMQSSYDKEEGYTIQDIEGIDPTDGNMLARVFNVRENNAIFVHGTDIVPDVSYGLATKIENSPYAIVSESYEQAVTLDMGTPDTVIVVTGYVYPYPLLVIDN